MRETPTLIKLSLGLNIGGTFDKKGIYYLCSVHFHKLMNDALRFMDSKAKNKESKRPLIGIENSAKRRQDIEHDYP